MDTWALRSRINEAAAILPDLLPAKRPDGVDYPNTILSPEFSIRREVRAGRVGGDALAIALPYYVVEGAGWGHLIGMSQYGAQAMAEAGSGYPEILAHYYGGLTPVPGDQFLPEQVAVGLIVGSELVRIRSDSPLNVVVDGVPVETAEAGSWGFIWVDGALQVTQPVPYVPPSGQPDEF